MRELWMAVALLAGLPASESASQALNAPSESIGRIEALSGDPKTDLGLGFDRNTMTIAPRGAIPCATIVRSEPAKIDREATYDLDLVLRSDELLSAVGIDASAGYRSPAFNLMASISSSANVELNSRTLTAVVKYSVDFTSVLASARPSSAIVKEFGLGATVTPERTARFYRQCGTHYVQAITRGVRLVAFLQIAVADRATQDKLDGLLHADGTFTGADRASLDLRFRSEVKTAAAAGTLRVRIKRIGGADFNDAAKGVLTSGIQQALAAGSIPEDALSAAVQPYLEDLTPENSTTVGARIMPYLNLYDGLRLASFDLSDQALEALYGHFLRLGRVQDEADGLVSGLDRRWGALTEVAQQNVKDLWSRTSLAILATRDSAVRCVRSASQCRPPSPLNEQEIRRGLPSPPVPPVVQLQVLVDSRVLPEADARAVLAQSPRRSLLARCRMVPACSGATQALIRVRLASGSQSGGPYDTAAYGCAFRSS